MNPIVKNILAGIAGIIVGSLVNMGIISLGPFIITPPEGMDPSDMDSLMEYMPTLGFKDFIVPFLAHALGTLAGAFTAAKIAASHQRWFGMGIGIFFLLGGISMVMALPSPLWFNILDLVGAYIPMGYLGYWLANRNKPLPKSRYKY